jgi:HAD superfamily phosphatase (TIGR01668 family)
LAYLERAYLRRCPVAGSCWGHLIPDDYYESIYDIDLDALKARGIRGLLLDLDNTLAAWRFGQPEPRLAEWMGDVRARGFRPHIISNDLGPRVDLFSRYLGISGTARAGKPRRAAFRKAVAALGLRPEEVAVVGDQIFTDVLGAKPMGCRTILVVPVSGRDFIGTRLVRKAERAWLGYLKARGIIGPPVRRSQG